MEVTHRLITGSQVRVAVADRSDVGECRRVAKRLAEGLRFPDTVDGRLGIIVTELATNLLRHAQGGEMLLQSLSGGEAPTVEVLAIDKGPGMSDVDACLRDGFSTAGSAGQGLGAVARMSSLFDLHSLPGRGTVVLSRVERDAPELAASERRRSPARFQFGAINIAVEGEIECGDTWRIAEHGTRVTLMVADGLGHGPLAAAAADRAADAFAARPDAEPAASIEGFHRALGGSRGAAAACAELRPDDARILYAGVGNIAGSVVDAERGRGMVSHNGTLGVKLIRIQQFDYDWPAGSLVIMHSDGISSRWSVAGYAGLQMRHPGVVAGVLYRDFVRRRDDATVLVARHR